MSQRDLSAAKALSEVADQAIHADELFAFPLSPEQERMWQADRERPGNAAYNAAYRWDLRGALDYSILECTFNEIVHRHDTLRSRFGLQNGTPQQLVADALRVPVSVTDLRALPEPER